jgi:hypothetical protein
MGGLLQKKEKSNEVITVNSQIGKEINCGLCGKLFTRLSTYHEFNKHVLACKQRAERNNLQNLIKELKEVNEEIEAKKKKLGKIKHKNKTVALSHDDNSGLFIFNPDNNSKTRKCKTEKFENTEIVKALPFEDKIEHFRKLIGTLKVDWREGAQTLVLDRDNFLKQSIQQITSIDLYKELKINFKGEVSHDAGGLIREWYTIIFKTLLSNELGLFEKADTEEYSFCISQNCITSIDNLDLFYFIGKILAKALLDNLTVNACFNKMIYKMILDEQFTLDDLIFINKPVKL